jgi:transitional endoplasmic reticulum ATPase
MPSGDPLDALRAALAVSPDNVPLRQHLAESLLGVGRAEEAEAEFRSALALAPDNTTLQLGLARSFFEQQKHSAALVVLEKLVKHRSPPAAAHALYARLLFQRGEVENAVAQYKLAIEIDPQTADDDLAKQLGVYASKSSEVIDGRLRAGWEEGPRDFSDNIERPTIGFNDVGGMDELKEEIRLKIIYPLEHKDLYAAYGKSIGGGILMYGPPGCGKTHLARATAGEIKAGFIPVGINDVLEMWMGNSERNLHQLFQEARDNAPCVLFFDEVDALGAKRSDMQAGSGRHLINQFLAEMDGVKHSNEGVLILAATNAPWHVDPAFRRPGRFDRVLFVPPPDQTARASILSILARGKPVKDIDYNAVAKKTDGFSGADMKAVIDQAVEAKLRQAMKTGKPSPLTTADFLAAVGTLKPTTKEWFSTARNHALYANQGGMYDDILKFLRIK